MSYYRAHRFYAAQFDCEALRLSVADAQGGEFYMIVPARGGREEREARIQALDMIAAAIEQGCDPGEVRAAD